MKKDYTYLYHCLAGLLLVATSVFNFINHEISSGVTSILLGVVFIVLGLEQKKKGRNSTSK